MLQRLQSFAKEIGFDRIGITSAAPPNDFHQYQTWVEKEYAGTMWYLTEKTRMEKRGDLQKILPGARSVVVGAISYAPLNKTFDSKIKFARYGSGLDYHDFVQVRLEKLATWLQQNSKTPFEYVSYVDTGPILERSLAERAGIGWIGKNTMVMSENTGSYLYLGELLTTLELPEDVPAVNRCGTCTRCLDACPTEAIVKPYELDARKCISYQTLENRKESIPSAMTQHLNGWVAGCDICQDVCPWNHEPLVGKIEEIKPLMHSHLSPEKILNLTETEFKSLFQKTAFLRMGLQKLKGNVKSAMKFTS